MSILIYRSQFPFTRDSRIRCMLEELGVPYDTETVHLLSDTTEFKKVNARGTVPFLVAHQESESHQLAMTESGAILLLLAEKHDTEGRFLPRNPVERARVYQWLFHTVSEIDPALAAIFANQVFFAGKDGAAAAVRANEAIFAKLAVFMEAALEKHDYIAGDKVSLADFALVVSLDWGERVKALKRYPIISAYYDRMLSRPSVAKVLREPAAASNVAA